MSISDKNNAVGFQFINKKHREILSKIYNFNPTYGDIMNRAQYSVIRKFKTKEPDLYKFMMDEAVKNYKELGSLPG